MKTSSEARIAASERIGGFESCHPSAPDRPESGLHPEARLLVVAPPAGQARQIGRLAVAVPLVDEASADRAGPRVQVLVRTPDGEVHVPVVQAQDQVAGRVRHVEPDDAALRVRLPRDRLDVEGLARVVLDSGKQHQGDRRAIAFEDLGDVRGLDGVLALPGPEPDERLGRVEAVKARLRLERVVVGGERVILEQDPMPLAGRPVEARHHQVEVGGKRVHRHDLARRSRGTDEPGHRLREELVVRQPRVLAREVRLDGEPPPLLQLFFDVTRGSSREQPQRVAGEVDLLLAALAPGNVELVPQPRERVAAIQRDGEVAPGPKRFAHGSKRPAGTPSHSSAVPCSSRARVSSGNPHDSINAPGRSSPSGKG